MKDGNGDDEGKVEPVRDEDVRFLALDQRHQEYQQIGHPDDREPEVGVPLGLRILLRLRHPEQIAGAGNQDEEIITEDDKPRREIAGETGPAGLLNHIERRRDQHVAAECEDHRGGVQRPQAAKAGPWQVEIQRGPGKLRRDQQSDREAGNSPKHRYRSCELDRAEIVIGPAIDFLGRQRGRAVEVAVEDRKGRREAGRGAERGVEGKGCIERLGRAHHAKKRRHHEEGGQTGLAVCHPFGGLRLVH